MAKKFREAVREQMSRGNDRAWFRHVTLSVYIFDNGADYAAHGHTARYSVLALTRPSGSVYRSVERPTLGAALDYYTSITYGNTFGPRQEWEVSKMPR